MKVSRWRWPLVTVIVSSFALGALWGWKMIRDRAEEEGRLESLSELNLLAPQGVIPQKLLIEFQRQERIRVVLHEDPFPGSLVRKALKSSPGQYDAALLYHYQVSALRNERRMISLFDARVKFPTSISPDFRKLPDDRNLMDTAPLQWGLLGRAHPKGSESKSPLQFAIWPGLLIGGEVADLPAPNFVSKYLPAISAMNNGESMLANVKAPNPLETYLVSHASLSFPPFKDLQLEFSGIPLADRTNERGYFLWILTLTAMADGDLESVRKLMRFLLDPARNLALVQTTKVGATTLRDQEALGDIPETLRSSYFRKFPLQSIIVERDERVRQADDLVEQAILGAAIVPKAVPVQKKPIVETEDPQPPPVRRSTPRPTPQPTPEPKAIEATPPEADELAVNPAPPAVSEPVVTEPSEEQSPGD